MCWDETAWSDPHADGGVPLCENRSHLHKESLSFFTAVAETTKSCKLGVFFPERLYVTKEILWFDYVKSHIFKIKAYTNG